MTARVDVAGKMEGKGLIESKRVCAGDLALCSAALFFFNVLKVKFFFSLISTV